MIGPAELLAACLRVGGHTGRTLKRIVQCSGQARQVRRHLCKDHCLWQRKVPGGHNAGMRQCRDGELSADEGGWGADRAGLGAGSKSAPVCDVVEVL